MPSIAQKNSSESCAKSIHPALLETQKQCKTSGSISEENVEHFKETEHDTVVLKSRNGSLDGSGKFAKFSVLFDKNPYKSSGSHTFCGSHRSFSLSLSSANEIAVTRIIFPIQMMNSNETKTDFAIWQGKNNTPLFLYSSQCYVFT